MSIPNRQIGWSNESNLLWYISSELEQIICQAACCTTTSTSSTSSTTTTTTTLSLCAVYEIDTTRDGSVARYKDCAKGEYVFLTLVQGDTSVVCAIRGSVSITFGIGTINEVDVCTPVIPCFCYLIVNPTFSDVLIYSYAECDGGSIVESSLSPGQSTVVCARENIVTLESGLLISEEGPCTPTEFCAGPAELCITYYISNNTGELINIGYTACGGQDQNIDLFPSSNTAICAQLGGVIATGATINLAVIVCV